MKKSEWSDKQLEDLLSKMPKIQDHRNPRDIYQNLSIKKRKRPSWIIPGFATAAAVLLFFLLVPKLLDKPNLSFDSAKQEQSSSEKISVSDDHSSTLIKKEDTDKKENRISGAEPKTLMAENNKTALYDYEVGNGRIITYWIPDSQAQILVPISIVVPPDENKNWLTVFTESMGNLKEEEWGLTDYYPLNATFTLDTTNNTITVDVPKNHPYGQGSAAEKMFINILKKTISSNSQVNKILLTTNGQKGIEFGNYGVMEELEVNSDRKHAYFFYTPDGLETTYLVPSSEIYQDINAAFEAMKIEQQDLGLSASLLSSFPIKEFTVKNNTLMITMDENKTMENNPATVYCYEAILLTAKEFGIKTITVVNPLIKHLGPFDLTKEMNVPLAANLRPIQ